VAKNPRNMSSQRGALNQGDFPTIGFVNMATVQLGVDLGELLAALNKQLHEHFVPIWGYPAKLYVTDKLKAGEWGLLFLDNADAADALGYHDITKDGQPISKVFVKSTIEAGQKVSVTASHELLEMLIDPGAQLWAQNMNGAFYAYEMCDAVEDEEYLIDDIAVSDFVYPSFFESWHQPGSVQFDYLKRVSRPFQTLQNGYQIVSDRKGIAHGMGGQSQSNGPANSSFGPAHSAMLYHLGQFLTTLAVTTNPSDSSEPPQLGARQVNPFPNHWQIDPYPFAARQVNPFPNPWEIDPYPWGQSGR
jgi:hypothetical protein